LIEFVIVLTMQGTSRSGGGSMDSARQLSSENRQADFRCV